MDSQSDSETFSGFSHFFKMWEAGDDRGFRVDLKPPHDDWLPFFTGQVKSEVPIQAHWYMGAAKPVDFVWTGFGVPVLVSERVVQIFRDGGFTGWDVIPVELRGKRGELLPTYYFLSVLGRCGPIAKSRSEVFQKRYPAGWFPMLKGLYFDPATWDGSDIFLPAGTGHKLVVAPVKRALVRAKVKNVVFTRIDKYEHDVSYS